MLNQNFLRRSGARMLLFSALLAFSVACSDDDLSEDSPLFPPEDPPASPLAGEGPILEESTEIPGWPAVLQDLDGLLITSHIELPEGSTTVGGADEYFSAVARFRNQDRDISGLTINDVSPVDARNVNGWTFGVMDASALTGNSRFISDGVRLHSFVSNGMGEVPAFDIAVRTVEPISTQLPVKGQEIDQDASLTIELHDPDPTGDYYYLIDLYYEQVSKAYSVLLNKGTLTYTVPAEVFATILDNPAGVKMQITKVRIQHSDVADKDMYFGISHVSEQFFAYKK